ncbi:MAG TPA: MBG domain-containing protein, partial [Verrucomicrobiae bacterium]|nr:MBG domain-containing protein [Verrucomicrobiae bacterium]
VLTAQVSLHTTATDTSPVGPYPVTASGIVASNYSIVYVQGTLTVIPPPPPPVAQAPVLSGNGDVAINWSASSNSVYRVQYKNDLSDSNWTDLTPDVTATGGTASYTDHPGQVSRRFYRIILLP